MDVADELIIMLEESTSNFRRVRKSAKSNYYVHNICLSLLTPVRRLASPHGTNQFLLNQFSLNLTFIFRKPVERILFSLQSEMNNWYLHEDLRIFVTISRLILLIMRNV